jgi:hypothetical protein
MSEQDAREVAAHHKAYMAAKEKQPKELTKEDFKKLVDDTIKQGLEPFKAQLQHLSIKEVEVSRTPNWIDDNIDVIVNLTDFDTEEALLEAWKNAKTTQAKNEKIKKVSDALNILSTTCGETFEEVDGKADFWIKVAEQFPSFIQSRIEEAVRVQLEEDKEAVRVELRQKYASQLKVVEVAIPFFKEILEVLK